MNFTEFPRLPAIVNSQGSGAWIEWAIQYRNMLVHRAPRAESNFLMPRSYILDSLGKQIPRTECVHLLVRQPGLTNVQALRVAPRGPNANLQAELFLTESSLTTLSHLFRNVVRLVSRMTPVLVTAWLRRRSEPTLLAQPVAQWKEDSPTLDFVGFMPGTAPVTADTMFMGDPWDRRLRASGTMDSIAKPRKR